MFSLTSVLFEEQQLMILSNICATHDWHLGAIFGTEHAWYAHMVNLVSCFKIRWSPSFRCKRACVERYCLQWWNCWQHTCQYFALHYHSSPLALRGPWFLFASRVVAAHFGVEVSHQYSDVSLCAALNCGLQLVVEILLDLIISARTKQSIKWCSWLSSFSLSWRKP